MGKKSVTTKATSNKNKEDYQNALEHTYHEDDDIIPSAEEIKKYQDVNPKFSEFFMERSKIEQGNRDTLNNKTLGFFNKVEDNDSNLKNKSINSENLRVVCAFIISLVFAYFSYDLIIQGHQIAGGLLGATTLAVIVNAFVRRPSPKKEPTTIPAEEFKHKKIKK